MPPLAARELQKIMLSALKSSFGKQQKPMHNAVRGRSNVVQMLINMPDEEDDVQGISGLAQALSPEIPGSTTQLDNPEYY